MDQRGGRRVKRRTSSGLDPPSHLPPPPPTRGVATRQIERVEDLRRRWRNDSILPSAVKREYVRMLRAAREDIRERGQWDPVDEAIKAAQARVNLDDPRVDDRLKRIRGAMCLMVHCKELALSVGTCVEIKVRALHAVDAT